MYKDYLVDLGEEEDEIGKVISKEQGDMWLNDTVNHHDLRYRNQDEIRSTERIWESGARITSDRVARYITILANTRPQHVATLKQLLAALVYFSKIETLLFGELTAPVIRQHPLVRSTMLRVSNCRNEIMERAMVDRGRGGASDGYTPKEFTTLLESLQSAACRMSGRGLHDVLLVRYRAMLTPNRMSHVCVCVQVILF